MRRLLRPSWLVMHVLVAVALYAMFRLGVWQWRRGQETGGDAQLQLRRWSGGRSCC